MSRVFGVRKASGGGDRKRCGREWRGLGVDCIKEKERKKITVKDNRDWRDYVIPSNYYILHFFLSMHKYRACKRLEDCVAPIFQVWRQELQYKSNIQNKTNHFWEIENVWERDAAWGSHMNWLQWKWKDSVSQNFPRQNKKFQYVCLAQAGRQCFEW